MPVLVGRDAVGSTETVDQMAGIGEAAGGGHVGQWQHGIAQCLAGAFQASSADLGMWRKTQRRLEHASEVIFRQA